MPERVIILEFKDRLKHLRKEKNLTQIELASILHYGYTAIANYENGRNQPRINDLIRLANVFGVSLDYLVGISDVKYYMKNIRKRYGINAHGQINYLFSIQYIKKFIKYKKLQS